MKLIKSPQAPIKSLSLCFGILPFLLLASCDQRKADVNDKKDATVDVIENQKIRVEEAGDQAREVVEASSEAARTKIDAEIDAAQAQLDADKVRTEANATAAKAEIDAERARADAERAKTDADVKSTRTDVDVFPGAASKPSDPANQ